MKELHIGTHGLCPENSRVISGKFNGISPRNTTGFMACIDLLCYKWLRWGNENDLAVGEPSIDCGQRLMRIGRQR
jgi:hypothetical protein